MIGNCNDDVSVLQAAIDYLNKHNAEPVSDRARPVATNLFDQQNGCCINCGKPRDDMNSLLVAENGEIEGLQCSECAAECIPLKVPA